MSMIGEQPPIFEEDVITLARATAGERRGAKHRDAGYSETVAALEFLPRRGGQRRRVLEAMAAAGVDGLADFQLEQQLNLARPSPGNRRGELAADGLVKRTGETRPTGSGSPADVWRITPLGIAVLAEIRRLDL